MIAEKIDLEIMKHDFILSLYQVGNFMQRADFLRYAANWDCRLSLSEDHKKALQDKIKKDNFAYLDNQYRVMEFKQYLKYLGKELIKQADTYSERLDIQIKKGVRVFPKTESNMYLHFTQCFKHYLKFSEDFYLLSLSSRQSFDWLFPGMNQCQQIMQRLKIFMQAKQTLLVSTPFKLVEKVLFDPKLGANIQWWLRGYPADILVHDINILKGGVTSEDRFIVKKPYCATHFLNEQDYSGFLKNTGEPEEYLVIN